SASAALGTVAVERIVDGLLVSLFVFGAFFSLRGPASPGWMMPTAYAALGVFTLALAFLVAAMRRPAATVKFCLNISLLPPNSPGLVGQFQWFTLLGLSLYLGGASDKASAVYPTAFAFANTHYGTQVIWYLGMGAIGLLTPWVSFRDLRKTGARAAD